MLTSTVKHNINLLVEKWISYVENDPEFYKDQESYKYKAVETFQQNFDLEAEDICGMLKAATKDSANLIQSGNYFPLKMLLQFCQEDPEFVRDHLKKLYDENVPVETRVSNFIGSSKERFVGDFQTYFDYRFLAFFLAARNPEKYMEIKHNEFRDFAKMVGYGLKVTGDQGQRFEILQRLAQDVRDVLRQNESYLEMHEKLVAPFEYKDPSLSWGTTDFIFNTARRIKDPFGEDVKKDIEEDRRIMEMKEDEMEDMIGSRKTYKEVENLDKEELLKKVKEFKKPAKSHVEKDGPYKIRIDDQRQKEMIKKIEDYACQVCGFQMEYRSQGGTVKKHIHADHIHDKRDGGSEDADNIWVLCPNCHAKKTLGVIVVDKKEGKFFESGREIELNHDSHLSWYSKKD